MPCLRFSDCSSDEDRVIARVDSVSGYCKGNSRGLESVDSDFWYFTGRIEVSGDREKVISWDSLGEWGDFDGDLLLNTALPVFVRIIERGAGSPFRIRSITAVLDLFDLNRPNFTWNGVENREPSAC